MAAPRGPHSDLWVVNVTTSATPIGEATIPAAIMPAMWAMSAIK